MNDKHKVNFVDKNTVYIHGEFNERESKGVLDEYELMKNIFYI